MAKEKLDRLLSELTNGEMLCDCPTKLDSADSVFRTQHNDKCGYRRILMDAYKLGLREGRNER